MTIARCPERLPDWTRLQFAAFELHSQDTDLASASGGNPLVNSPGGALHGSVGNANGIAAADRAGSDYRCVDSDVGFVLLGGGAEDLRVGRPDHQVRTEPADFETRPRGSTTAEFNSSPCMDLIGYLQSETTVPSEFIPVDDIGKSPCRVMGTISPLFTCG